MHCRFRDQNAVERLLAWIRKAAHVPTKRQPNELVHGGENDCSDVAVAVAAAVAVDADAVVGDAAVAAALAAAVAGFVEGCNLKTWLRRNRLRVQERAPPRRTHLPLARQGMNPEAPFWFRDRCWAASVAKAPQLKPGPDFGSSSPAHRASG
mmetsp:Transcript_102548/g.295253  ORF Transcript_102548/g.295253 Transcript_102548/m.295253 type:complete len:152 (-) Transcript_102548:1460-1915(-)